MATTVVDQAADLVPGSTWALVDIYTARRLPKGVLNLVIGRGTEVGVVLLEHPDVARSVSRVPLPPDRRSPQPCIASRADEEV